MAERLEGTNLSPQTFLATDYLNHFNEVVMLLGMLGDMPEMFEDIAAWAPKTHAEHFRDSSLSDRDLAIAAYEMAPARYRVPFDDTTAQANEVVRRRWSRLPMRSRTTIRRAPRCWERTPQEFCRN